MTELVYERTMRAELLLKRLLIAVAFVAAVVFVAPSGAQAHPGHTHELRTQNQSHVQIPKTVAHKQAAATERTVRVVSTRSTASGKTVSLLAASNPEKPQVCLAGCCRSAGAGCCPAAVLTSVEIALPCLGRSRQDFAVLRKAGITLGTLPEPPKSLVQ
jgi:hypothetical protein